ncbi:MAG: hypothetical protein CMO01_16870 [Thalassobius sp.]|nr:hypothetical protein [Thalassovita sp.]
MKHFYHLLFALCIIFNAEAKQTITNSDTTILFEAEESYNRINDPGYNPISVISNSIFSNEKAITLYDKRDEVEYQLNVPDTGLYNIKIKVRSGNSASKTAFWNNGYEFKLNDNIISLKGDTSTITEYPNFYGHASFGVMEIEDVAFSAGLNTFSIKALIPWGIVDYIEVSSANEVVCEGTIILRTQADVDSCNCTIVKGTLYVGDMDTYSDIVDLSPLSKIKETDELFIGYNYQLEYLTDFSFTTLKVLSLFANTSLKSIKGLEKIKEVTENIYISDNYKLESFDGLNNLTTSKGYFYITNNSVLNDISSLQSLTSIERLIIFGNRNLNDCCSISKLVSSAIYKNIENNGTGCNSLDEIESTCNTSYTYESETYYRYNVKSGRYSETVLQNGNMSSGRALALYAKGDELYNSFNVPETGYYKLKIYLRSGDTNNAASYSYDFTVNGTPYTFTLDTSSIVHYPNSFGDSYFGYYVLDNVELIASSNSYSKVNNTTITTNSSWAVADHFVVEPIIDDSNLRVASLAQTEESDIFNTAAIEVYPNPVQDILNLNYVIPEYENAQLKIVNLMGKEIFAQSYTEYIDEQIDVSSWAKGMYILNIQSGTNKITQKVIVD